VRPDAGAPQSAGEDLIIYSGEEFGYFELADAVATGSSLMPAEKNPDRSS